MEFQCPLDYNPHQRYTRRELIELIQPHGAVLCFLAQAAGYRQGVLGLDFDRYDPTTGMVPVHVMDRATAQVLAVVEGPRFRRALATSRTGQGVVVTFSSPSATGWFRLPWALPAAHLRVA